MLINACSSLCEYYKIILLYYYLYYKIENTALNCQILQQPSGNSHSSFRLQKSVRLYNICCVLVKQWFRIVKYIFTAFFTVYIENRNTVLWQYSVTNTPMRKSALIPHFTWVRTDDCCHCRPTACRMVMCVHEQLTVWCVVCAFFPFSLSVTQSVSLCLSPATCPSATHWTCSDGRQRVRIAPHSLFHWEAAETINLLIQPQSHRS